MYRYCVDNAITYTSEDFVLFRESPFACWMERLNLENPDHGIPPDVGSKPPENSMERQDDLGDTLRAEGKNVYTVDWDAEEPVRRNSTLEAMRGGVDFIVNGQLALGPLSGSANLLMRTSGYSELGNFLYIPCDTQAKTTLHSAFRLCFLADLLHSLQGQLPPQLLIIRGGADLLPLQTEDHIYHYRAVKQRFMETMRTFRKHRMPDPVESSHFGRWSECANEVLKQRALRSEEPVAATEEQPELDHGPMPRAAAAAAPAPAPPEAVAAPMHGPRNIGSKGLAVSGTLADQARMLQRGDNPAAAEPPRGAAETALQDLEFIGRRRPPSLAPRSAEPRSSAGGEYPEPAAVDRDEIQPIVPPPVLNTDSTEFEVDCIDDSDYQLPYEPTEEAFAASSPEKPEAAPTEGEAAQTPFNSSLHTSGADRD